VRVLTAALAVTALLSVGCTSSSTSSAKAFHEPRTPHRTQVTLGELKIRGLRLIASRPGSTDPAGYLVMTIVNGGTRPDHFLRALVSGNGYVAPAGVTTAEPRRAVQIGSRQPSGISPALPITGLPLPLKAGAVANVSLFFADAGHTSVEVPVDHFSLAVPTPS